MKKFYILVLIVLISTSTFAQNGLRTTISAMRWSTDYKLHVKMANDSAYIVDVKGLYHTNDNLFIDTTDHTATYYPVSLDREFIDYIKNKNLLPQDTIAIDTSMASNKTLWSAVHSSIGGGYIHFVNCLIYALESKPAMLNSPIFERPITNWKPSPVTKSYKRTHKWKYYYPSTQKLAQKEYKHRLKENDMSDLHGVPARFIDLFMNTSQSEYLRFRQEGRMNEVAQIDLIRILLGAKYLGEAQIRSISNSVITAVMEYNMNAMPSIIIFDDYNAAVAMSLQRGGYKVDRIVYSDGEVVSGNELEGRTEIIEQLIKTINEANERVFQKRLRQYYQRKRR